MWNKQANKRIPKNILCNWRNQNCLTQLFEVISKAWKTVALLCTAQSLRDSTAQSLRDSTAQSLRDSTLHFSSVNLVSETKFTDQLFLLRRTVCAPFSLPKLACLHKTNDLYSTKAVRCKVNNTDHIYCSVLCLTAHSGGQFLDTNNVCCAFQKPKQEDQMCSWSVFTVWCC